MAATLIKQPEGDDYQFHVIGDGKLRAALEHSANQLGLAQLVSFHGHRKDMAACISSLDAIVMCSDHEGTPMTALEAMALGTPLVAHKVGGLAEVLSPYPELQVTEHTPTGYAKTVKKIVQANEAYPVSLPHGYTSEQNAAATISLYRELLL
jgi:glycosyltransferase involved in cell wall biosynthesis